MEFLVANIAPIMFGGLIVFLLLGFPVAFSLGACGLFFGFLGIELGLLPEALLQGSVLPSEEEITNHGCRKRGAVSATPIVVQAHDD